MKIKKILALMAAGTMLMTMGGCNAITIDGEEKVREGSSGNVIGFSVSTLNNPFFVTLTEGARKAATENNVELVVVDAGDDAAKQTSDIEDLVSRNVGVLIVNPVDSDAVAPAVKSAMSSASDTASSPNSWRMTFICSLRIYSFWFWSISAFTFS